MIVEVCCGSYYDAKQAFLGGADRVELNSALHLGGLTPSVANLILSKRYTSLKVIAMVRPRAGGFCYNEEDFQAMEMDTLLMLENGADGIAFGCLTEDGELDIEKNKKLIHMIKQKKKEAVFHRAFDCVKDPYKAIETLIELGVNRVLTSGLQAKAVDGKDLLKDLQEKYGHKIQILAGSGLNADNAKEFLEYTGIQQIHSSCKDWKNDPTTSGEHVTYSYANAPHENDYDVVSKELCEKLVAIVK